MLHYVRVIVTTIRFFVQLQTCYSRGWIQFLSESSVAFRQNESTCGY